MRKIAFFIALTLTISLWGAAALTCDVQAAASPTLTSSPITPATITPPVVSIDIRDGRLFLRADGAGIREILNALEAKTGTRYLVHEGVPDEKRTLNLSSISLHDTETLLRNLSLNNYIVTYDRKEAHTAIYILPEGHSLSDFLNGRPQLITIRNAFKQSPSKEIRTVKDKPFETLPQKEGRGGVSYIQGEILIKFHRGVMEEERSAILSKYGLTRSPTDQSLSNLGYTKVQIPLSKDLSSLLKEVTKERQIKTIEPNYVLKTNFQVNDPLYINQWYIPETRFDIAWDYLKSKTTIPVAVIDTGIDVTHPDLRNRILPGYDFVHNTPTPNDDNGHGTFVAGIIAAQADTIGIRGLYDQARILPVKVMDENGLGTYEDAAKGIVWAADQGTKVINLSIGGYGYSYLLQDAVDYALEKGCIVVAAGGNDSIDRPIYPAAYPDVIGVAALADNGKIWVSSNWGRHIDVSAPGDHILSTSMNGEYVYASGTSAATPMVSALAAMIVNERPDLSSTAIEQLIQQSAIDLGDKGRDKIYGAGVIDAQAALNQTVNPFHDVAVRSVHVEPKVFEKGKTTYIIANIENTGTYKSEKFDVVLYKIVGEERKEIGRQGGIDVIDKTRVVFEWKPESARENVTFEVSSVSINDSNSLNNIKITNSSSLTEVEGLYILHAVDPPVHQWIAGEAYNLLPAGDMKDEIYKYIGPKTTITVVSMSPPSMHDVPGYLESYWIIKGAKDEDDDLKWFEHFWKVEDGPTAGGLDLPGFDTFRNAYQRALEYWNAAKTSYISGNTADAYYKLGGVAHLLVDMSVPAHTLNDQHLSGDRYELYMTEWNDDYANRFNYHQWTATGSLVKHSSLLSQFQNLAEIADQYESDDYDGKHPDHYKGHNGDGIYDTSYAECLNHGNILMPKAIQFVAGLYQLFWDQTHATLTVTKQGAGSGLVKSDFSDIYCGTTCTAEFVKNSPVMLTATASPGSSFAGWTGCSSTNGSICTVNMDATKTVTARFEVDTSSDPIVQKFAQAYLGASVMGNPVNAIHEWGGYSVQDYPDMPGFGRSIMIYNPGKDKVYIVHGDIWAQVYEPMGGVNSWLGLPTSNEYSYPVNDSPDNVRQDFEHGFITHISSSDPWWKPYSYSSNPPTINPTIAQTDTGEYPPKFSQGTTIREWGTGFTPNNYATLHFLKPDNTEYPTLTQPLDSIGHFDIAYTMPFTKPPGIYTWWAIDNRTGVKSNEVSFEVTSGGSFAGTLTVTSPNGGEMWRQGETYYIRWTASPSNLGTDVKINLQRLTSDGDLLATYEIFNGEDPNGQRQWTVPEDRSPGTKYKIKITSNIDNSIHDRSDSVFTITPKLPDKATGPSIGNGATNVSIDLILDWAQASNATSYDIYFGTTSNPSSVGNQTFTNFYPGILKYNTTYYWRIDSRNSGGVTRGDTWQFTTEKGGAISGYVKHDSDSQPIQGLWVEAYDFVTGANWRRAQTQVDGSYEIAGLLTESYRVRVLTDDTYFISEYYKNSNDWNSATPVAVTFGQTTSDVNIDLALGGKISGFVKRDSDNQPVQGVYVYAYDFATGQYYVNSAHQIQADGSYTISGLPAGNYRVQVMTHGTDFISESYDDAIDPDLASPVAVMFGQTTSGVNFSLVVGGKISGFVMRDSNNQPIQGVSVYAYDTVTGHNYGNTAATQADGSYTITGLPAGNYRVYASAFYTDFISEYYNDTQNSNSATLVTVTVGQTISGVNFSLVLGGKIFGYVKRDSDDQPVQNLWVSASSVSGGTGSGAYTQSDGTYWITGLPPGQYLVYVSTSGTNYISEYYNNVTSSSQATPVNVTAGQTTQNVDFGLANGGSISGKVTKEGTTDPIAGLSVTAYSISGGSSNYAYTQPNGTYTIIGLATEQYQVYLSASGTNYISEYYNNATTSSQAEPVNVTAGQTTPNIDFGLATGGSISGKVTKEETTDPIAGLWVAASSVAGGPSRSARTQTDGSYTIIGLATEQYQVYVSASGTNYISEYYNNVTSSSQATPVSVTAGQTTPNIDFGLAQRGGISGKVTKEGTTDPIVGLSVFANPVSGAPGWGAQTQADGTYMIIGLMPGQYWVNVSTSGTNYISEYYNNVTYSSQATPVNVIAGQTTPNIDFSLATGGSISGKVTKEGTTDPIAGLWVSASSVSDGSGNYAYTQSDGSYAITGLAPGQYRILVSSSGTNYISEYYNNVTSSSQATPVNVTAGQTTPNIDFGLATAGSISGKVTKEGTTDPIAGLYVSASSVSDSSGSGSYTQSDGTYSITGLAPGQYRVYVSTSGTNYIFEYYNNVTSSNQATPVNVVTGQTTPNIDFGLAQSGGISGKVTKEGTTDPIAGLYVSASSVSDSSGSGAYTQSDGTYTIIGLATGQYQVYVSTSGTNYIFEYYNNVTSSSQATPVNVTAGQTTPNIDFGLVTGGSISGKVTKEGTTDPIAGLYVSASSVSDGSGSGAYTQSDGTYTIVGLATGQYQVYVSAFGTNYIFEYYNNVTSSNQATPVNVTAGQTTPNIDFGLATGGSISGKVTKEGTTDPIAGLWVTASSVSGGSGRGIPTQSDGTYTIIGLAPGQYRVNVSTSGTNYISEYYNNVTSSSQATPVNVTAGQTTQNVDFGLAQGGGISGIVTSDATGQPIQGLTVAACLLSGGSSCPSGATQANGTYTITNIMPGQYRVQVFTSSTGFMPEYYNNVTQSGAATPVVVSGGQTTANINFGLSQGSKITGIVTSEATSSPIPGAWVYAFDNTTYTNGSAQTQADGTYTIVGLAAGNYLVSASASGTNYVGEYYNNAPYSVQATPVVVAADQTKPNINFSLATGGKISGKVTRDSDGQPVQGLEVSALGYQETVNLWPTSVTTAPDGTYTIGPLSPGQYRVSVNNVIMGSWPNYTQQQTEYVREYYRDTTNPLLAQPVPVTADQTTPNIDFGLTVGGKITGRVTKDADGQPIAGLWVYANAYRTGDGYGSAQTQADGTYTIMGLPAGNYTVNISGGTSGYISEYYNNVNNLYTAAKVSVTLGQTTPNIDFGLSPGGTIAGTVYRESDHQPLSYVSVQAFNIATGNTVSGATKTDGTYTIMGLPAGNYRVSISYATGYAAEYYYNTTQKNAATLVPVTAGQTTSNINFGLVPAGKVTGTVTDGSGLPIAGLTVYAYDTTTGMLINTTQTTYNGAYTFTSLSTGQYHIAVRTIGTNYALAYYNNTPNRADAATVIVLSDQTTSNINFALSSGGRITGMVTDNVTHQPIPGINVVAYPTDPDGSYGGWTAFFNGTTLLDGTYTISGLPPGNYRVTTRTTTQYSYTDKYFAQANNYMAATAVPVTAGQTTPNIDIGLDAGGSITGWVKSSGDNNPLDSAYVKAYDAQTGQRMGRWTAAGTDGHYEILGLPPGSYKVYVETGDGSYAAQWYDNSPALGGATPVGVVAGQLTLNIDFLPGVPAVLTYLYANFAGSGIWKWDGSAWSHLTASAPQDMVISGLILYGDFGSGGIWKWDGSAWSQVTASDPNMMVVSGSILYGAFGSGGIWKWDGAAWSQVTMSVPQDIVVSGSVLYGDFGSGGIWKWDGSAWSHLTASDPDMMVVSGSTLYGAFGSGGIWKWDGSAWSQVTASDPDMMAVSGSILYGVFGSGGIWKWDGAAWSQVTMSVPQNIAVSGSILYGDFGSGGIWKWDGAAWDQVTASDPASMVTGP